MEKKGKKIAEGGFAKIYESKHGGKTCAIKYADTEENSRRHLRREVNILNHLKDCKHVVKMLEYKISRSGYIKYELLDEELLTYMYKKDSYKHRKNIIVQLRKAIVELHSHGVVHCDIKPENIMVDKSGTLKFIDFGHAVLFDELATKKICIGTLPYRCPEYILESKVDHTADYWSIGCIILEMFHGDAVFADKKDNEVTRHGYMLGLIMKIFGDVHPDLIEEGEWSDNYYDMKTKLYLYDYLVGRQNTIDTFISDLPRCEYEFYHKNIIDFFYKDLLTDKFVKRFVDPPAQLKSGDSRRRK